MRRPTQIDLEFIREVKRPTLHFTLRNMMMVQERRH
jgi:hypothetical protein